MPNKKFPCPYCRGQGGEFDVVLDFGQGPWYDCGVCEGKGVIEINGPMHQKMKQYKADSKKTRIAPGIYQFGPFSIMKVAENCWRITNRGYGQDFKTKKEAYEWCEQESINEKT